jgi:hypothetical protein
VKDEVLVVLPLPEEGLHRRDLLHFVNGRARPRDARLIELCSDVHLGIGGRGGSGRRGEGAGALAGKRGGL